ncbi:MAG: PEP-CTERM sorting domain-containing protein [Deltaproteobacteria bacterium]|nr:PEP-CTERM sorting domain-containing protein [Deltaproteobacteria bacterium]
MKKFTVLLSLIAVLAMSHLAAAATYNFEDMIDSWTSWQVDAVSIMQNNPLEYTHDINDSVDFAAGDYVTEAWLELDFTNDLLDGNGKFIFRYDNREYASYAYDGQSWISIGEVDNGQYDLILNVDWLNDNGLLDVVIAVSNPLGTATAWLDHSRLYGTAETAPVPEPATMLLLGVGLVGLAGYRRFARK